MLLAAAACANGPPADLSTLVQQDSVYLTPDTGEPFTGRVFRRFADKPDANQIEGALQDGRWEGEFTAYHPSGRVRYQGRMHEGAPCGAWVENRDDEEAEDIYQALKQEIESMGLYPPCPER